MSTLDLIVIGGGSGGLATARAASAKGARVALVEPKALGGTCVNVGCVPKKVMYNAAHLLSTARHGADYGFKVDVGKHDWATLKSRRDAYVARLNGIYQTNVERDEITLLRGRAKFVSHDTVEANGQRLTAPHILIATGGYPKQPTIPGAQLGITSNGFFELEDMPARVTVVGTGYIGVEFAGVLAALGASVTLVSRNDGVLRGFDGMLRESLLLQLKEHGINVITHQEPTRLSRTTDSDLQLFSGSKPIGSAVDSVIWAVGRAPATAGLGLEQASVKTDDRGFINVDAYQNTSQPGIYAVGDVTGQAALTPVAIAAGRHLAERLFGQNREAKLEYEQIPSVVFSHPPVGTVGLTEEEALKKHGPEQVKIFTSRFVNMFYALSEKKPATQMKLVTVGKEQRVVGVHLIGMGSDEMLQGFAVAVRAGLSKADFDRTVALHPTAAEELVTMR